MDFTSTFTTTEQLYIGGIAGYCQGSESRIINSLVKVSISVDDKSKDYNNRKKQNS